MGSGLHDPQQGSAADGGAGMPDRAYATSSGVAATGRTDVDGLLSGAKWIGTVTYSFTDSPSDYRSGYGSGEPLAAGFAQISLAEQQTINNAVSLIRGYTNLSIQYAGTDTADIEIARSSAANPTAYAYYPSSTFSEGGDIWLGTSYNYGNPKLGNYSYLTHLHEFGHSLGLKHSQDAGGVANTPVPIGHDDLEYTVMSYRSYIGGSTTGGYTNENFGFSQTYMMNDILALQNLYGANYTTNGTNTVYSWSATTGEMFINGIGQGRPGGATADASANRVFTTIWDGNGNDTFDCSNYTTSLNVDLRPGSFSVLSDAQKAYLGDGHYAAGNVYNSYLFNGDTRSLIENAIAGSGNDVLTGNDAGNYFFGGLGNDWASGGAGSDVLNGGRGMDTLIGGSGADTFLFDSAALADARLGIFDRVVDYDAGYLGYYSALENDLFDLSGIFADPFYSGQQGSSFVRAIEDAGGQFASLEVEASGANSTMVWLKLAELQGEAPGASLRLVLGGGQVATLSITAATITTTLIEANGATRLSQIGNHYQLTDSANSGPSLKFAGTDVVTGQYGVWVPISAEQVSGGYLVAWKAAGSDQYTVWNTDPNGNYISNLLPVVPGANDSLRAYENAFHQDLNGDGQIGVVATLIEANGATRLSQTGNHYQLTDSANSGPSLKFAGTDVVTGQYGVWVPISAEQVSGGYLVAWKAAGSEQYTVWNTDPNGNFISNLIPVVPGATDALRSYESSFHQDLNGDGQIGLPTTTIEANGATHLAQAGNHYYLLDGANSGPSLKITGADVSTGQYGIWTPTSAEQTSGGYLVAWKAAGADQYTVWNTDPNGNYISNLLPVISGASNSFKAYEPSFHQDLNGDGLIGLPAGAGAGIDPIILQQWGSDLLV